jgi:predicted Rossmann fold nucleotide-binding protein DprA/Smf involved in DNA uptake
MAMNMEVRTISAAEFGLVNAGGGSLVPNTPSPLSALGSPALLRGDKVGLFCSVRCPGDLILRAYDYAKKLRDDGVAVIGGFHSPVEKECLRILLRGIQPVIICPARSLTNMRITREWQREVEKGRLLLVSPFAGSQKRATAELAQERNKFVAAVADRVCFIYTTPGGSMESLARYSRQSAKPFVDLPRHGV